MAELREDEMFRLIDLYREQENLYNFQLDSYHNRDMARESLLYIASQMGKGWDLQITKAKLKSLRDGYTRNRSLVESSLKSGASRDDVFKVRWKWFGALDFLRPYIKLNTRGVSNLTGQKDQGPKQNESTSENMTEDIYPPGDSQLMDADDFADSNPNSCERVIHDILHKNKPQRQPLASLNPSTAPYSTGSVTDEQLSHQLSPPSTSNTAVASRRSTPSPANSQSPPESPASSISSSNSAYSPAPDFARLERKRKNSADVSTTIALLSDMAGQMKENAKRRMTEKANSVKSDNEVYCLHLARQLDKLSSISQIRTRKQIDDIVFEAMLQEHEAQQTAE